MEGAIIDFDAGTLAAAVALGLLLVGDEQLIVEAEAALGHAGQEGLHHDLTDHFAAEDSAGLGDEQVHALQGVDEHLVLTVGDTFTTPRVTHTRNAYQSIAPVTWEVMELASSSTSSEAVPRRMSTFIRSIAQFWG